ncbi:MAG: HAD-IB family hydrolase [Myxococcota bacterium]
MATALFDLDRTLIDCNSARLWAAAEWREGRIGLRDVAWAGYWLSRYGLGYAEGIEGAIEAAVRSVAGAPEAEIDARVRAWFTREVAHRRRPGTAEVLERHRAQGDRLVLATSGTVYAARAAGEAFGIDTVIGTTLEVVDGRFTGRVATSCVGPGKTKAVEDWAAAAGADLDGAWFYTDSASDLTLLERVAHPVVVHPDRTLRRIATTRGWPIVSWG